MKQRLLSTVPGSFEIHWARQYLVSLTGMAGIVKATIYNTEPKIVILFNTADAIVPRVASLW